MIRRLPALALSLGLCAFGTANLSAQTRTWSASGAGSWMDPTNWSPIDVPDTETESARFDRVGSYAINLSDASATVVDDLEITRGDLTFRSIGVETAALHVHGDADIDGDIELAKLVAPVSVDVHGHLSLSSGKRLLVSEGHLAAGSVSLVGGTNLTTTPTQLVLDDGSTADFGATHVASSTSNPSQRISFEVADGSVANVAGLFIANADPTAIGEVNVLGSQLIQAAGSKTIIGRAISPAGSGRGTLAVAGGGSTANLGEVEIEATGHLVNSGAMVGIADRLTLRGGVYQESGAATRGFADGIEINLSQAAELRLANQPLRLTEGSLSLTSGSVSAPGGIELTGGDLHLGFDGSNPDGTNQIDATTQLDEASLFVERRAATRFGDDFGMTGDSMLRIEAGDPAQHNAIEVAGSAMVSGMLKIELPTDPLLNPGNEFTLLSAEALTGSFDTLDFPSLPAGLKWQLDTTPTSLSLRVIEGGLTGDFNDDGRVDAADYTVWRDTAGTSGQALAADANGDQTVNEIDLSAWRQNYGATASATAIPEPAAACLATLVLAMLAPAKLARGPFRA